MGLLNAATQGPALPGESRHRPGHKAYKVRAGLTVSSQSVGLQGWSKLKLVYSWSAKKRDGIDGEWKLRNGSILGEVYRTRELEA